MKQQPNDQPLKVRSAVWGVVDDDNEEERNARSAGISKAPLPVSACALSLSLAHSLAYMESVLRYR